MSRKQSFEEALRQKMNELPLPGENESWQKMKELLNEKKKRRAFLFFKNKKVTGSAILLLLLCLWLYISPEKTTEPSGNTTLSHQTIEKENADAKKNKESVTNEGKAEHKITSQENNSANHSSPSQLTNAKEVSSSQQTILSAKNKENKTVKTSSNQKGNHSSANKSVTTNEVIAADINKTIPDKSDHSFAIILPDAAKPSQDINLTPDSSQFITDINTEKSSSGIKKTDSSGESLIKKDSLQLAADAAAANASKAAIIIRKHNPYFIDAGIGITQQLPVGGQKLMSYNYNGNKSVFTDYFPHVYLKLEKDKRWFVESEFHYASPRFVSEFAYYQTSKADYSHSNTNKEIYRLQKTWYTQLPLSLNIYVRPSWSVGAGVMYSRLHGAAASKETITNDALSGKQTATTELLPIKGFTDSFLYKTTTNLLLQTDYTKGRWSFGLRCLQDVQPYLAYTSPAGEQKNKRNASLQLMIRYLFYRPAAFRLGK